MSWSDEITLVVEEKQSDGEGYRETAATQKRKIFANKKSTRRSEFYAAKQAGEDIAIVFEVKGVDYNGERIVEYKHDRKTKPTRYRVVRDYTENGEEYELNCALDSTPNTVARRRA